MTASLTKAVILMISSSQTSAGAWHKLQKLYASQSCSHIMGLTESLIKLSQDSSSVAGYLCHVKGIIDNVGNPIRFPMQRNIVLHTLNRLGPEVKEISAAIRAKNTVISFEELHDKLIEHESFFKREENLPTSMPITANTTRFPNKNGNLSGKKSNNIILVVIALKGILMVVRLHQQQ
ncbi:hypothetical protein ACOSQ2_012575 [Xanthoceras sorbifolium]